ncbi:hypothetical protein DFH06DRAFT_1152562 [Mycena polygramma]|nr:hypothetical protein DFH06DRAFT_1152562 [Mycena polygramma]
MGFGVFYGPSASRTSEWLQIGHGREKRVRTGAVGLGRGLKDRIIGRQSFPDSEYLEKEGYKGPVRPDILPHPARRMVVVLVTDQGKGEGCSQAEPKRGFITLAAGIRSPDPARTIFFHRTCILLASTWPRPRDRHRSRKYGVRYGAYGLPYPYRMDQNGLLHFWGHLFRPQSRQAVGVPVLNELGCAPAPLWKWSRIRYGADPYGRPLPIHPASEHRPQFPMQEALFGSLKSQILKPPEAEPRQHYAAQYTIDMLNAPPARHGWSQLLEGLLVTAAKSRHGDDCGSSFIRQGPGARPKQEEHAAPFFFLFLPRPLETTPHRSAALGRLGAAVRGSVVCDEMHGFPTILLGIKRRKKAKKKAKKEGSPRSPEDPVWYKGPTKAAASDLRGPAQRKTRHFMLLVSSLQ